MDVCVCIMFVSGAMEVRWCSNIPWNWSYRILLTATWFLGFKHKTSMRTEVLLSSEPSYLYLLNMPFKKIL